MIKIFIENDAYKKILNNFPIITTATIIVFSFFEAYMNIRILLIICLISSLPTILSFNVKHNLAPMLLLQAFLFSLIATLVILSQLFFGVIESLEQALRMLGIIFIIYLIVSFGNIIRIFKLAKEINNKISELATHNEDDAT